MQRVRAETGPWVDREGATGNSTDQRPEDVLREHLKAASVMPRDELPIVLSCLRKVFPGSRRKPGNVAVADLSLCLADGECFGCGLCAVMFAG
jgi:hypothetical protein